MSLTYFVDDCLDGDDFVIPLRAAGIDVHPYHEVFAERLDDEEWIPAVANAGWVAVTGDISMRWKPIEIQAINQARLRMLHLARRRSPPHALLAANLVNTLPGIERFFDKHPPPVVGQLRLPDRLQDVQAGKPGRVEARTLYLPPGY